MIYATLSTLKAACSEAHQDALSAAKKECGRGTYVSRGRHFKAFSKDALVTGEAECWPWDGSMTSLKEAIVEAARKGADTLVIECGIDYAETPRHYADGEYDPWVGEWSIEVWKI